MEIWEAMTSSTHLFAYSYQLFQKKIVENYEYLNVISSIFLIRFISNFHCYENVTLCIELT